MFRLATILRGLTSDDNSLMYCMNLIDCSHKKVESRKKAINAKEITKYSIFSKTMFLAFHFKE